VVAAQYWWEMTVVFIYVLAQQMGEGVNVILMDIKIGEVSECVIIFILNMR
jgi:hypothetical protein